MTLWLCVIIVSVFTSVSAWGPCQHPCILVCGGEICMCIHEYMYTCMYAWLYKCICVHVFDEIIETTGASDCVDCDVGKYSNETGTSIYCVYMYHVCGGGNSYPSWYHLCRRDEVVVIIIICICVYIYMCIQCTMMCLYSFEEVCFWF